jgi:beta-glucosidase
MHANRSLLTDVLRGRLGFQGLVVGDWNAHGQISGCTNERCAAAFQAGVDMLMTPDSWRGYYQNALAQARSGEITAARLDEAVARILRVKLRMGLFEQGAPSSRTLGGQFKLIGHANHRRLARQAVRESLVLLKNDGGVLPLDPRRHILVAGDGADSVMKQSGGWTLTWQGTGLSPSDFPNAQSIWAGLREQIAAAGGRATLSEDARYTDRPDAAIVVFGENPYAEFQGDLETLDFTPDNDVDLERLLRLKAAGIPVVSVFLSGRPLWVNREINASDAFVAAWLPGSEGGGVADVLLRKADGSVAHDFKGKLSFSWPRTAVQTPLNVGDAGYDPQFPFDYGLRYADDGKLAALPEQSGLSGRSTRVGNWFVQGTLAGGAQFAVDSGRESVRIATLPAASADGRIRVSAIDRNAQEDARRIEWRGGGEAALSVIVDAPVNLNRQTNGDMSLVLELRVDAAPTAPLWLEMRCGEGCSGRVDLHPALVDAPDEWLRLGIPLKCLRDANADMQKIDVPLRLVTEGKAALSLSGVALGTDADRSLACLKR